MQRQASPRRSGFSLVGKAGNRGLIRGSNSDLAVLDGQPGCSGVRLGLVLTFLGPLMPGRRGPCIGVGQKIAQTTCGSAATNSSSYSLETRQAPWPGYSLSGFEGTAHNGIVWLSGAKTKLKAPNLGGRIGKIPGETGRFAGRGWGRGGGSVGGRTDLWRHSRVPISPKYGERSYGKSLTVTPNTICRFYPLSDPEFMAPWLTGTCRAPDEGDFNYLPHDS